MQANEPGFMNQLWNPTGLFPAEEVHGNGSSDNSTADNGSGNGNGNGNANQDVDRISYVGLYTAPGYRG